MLDLNSNPQALAIPTGGDADSTDTKWHFSLTTGSSPWSFWRRRVPRQSACALGPHVVHRPSKALEGYNPFKSTDLRDPVLGEIAEREEVTPAQEVIRAHPPRSRRDPKVRLSGAHRQQLDVLGFALDDAELYQIDGLMGKRVQ